MRGAIVSGCVAVVGVGLVAAGSVVIAASRPAPPEPRLPAFGSSAGSTVPHAAGGNEPASSGLTSVVPARLVETRAGLATVDGLLAGGGGRSAGSVLEVPVLGRGGLPDAGVGAVLLNVTAVGPLGPGYLTVFPCGAERPLASNVNYLAGEVVPNAVLAKVGDGGAVCVFTKAATDLVIDVNGWFGDGSGVSYSIPDGTTLVGPTEVVWAAPGATADEARVVVGNGRRHTIGDRLAIASSDEFPDGMFAEVIAVDTTTPPTLTVMRVAVSEVLDNLTVEFAGPVSLDTSTWASPVGAEQRRSMSIDKRFLRCEEQGFEKPAAELFTELTTPITVDFEHLKSYFAAETTLFAAPWMVLQLNGEAVASVGVTATTGFTCEVDPAVRQQHRLSYTIGAVAGIPVTFHLEPAFEFAISASGHLGFSQRHYFGISVAKTGFQPLDVDPVHSRDDAEVEWNAAIGASAFAGGSLSLMFGGGYRSARAEAGVYGDFGVGVEANVSAGGAGASVCARFSAQFEAELGVRLDLLDTRWESDLGSASGPLVDLGEFCLGGPTTTTTTTSPVGTTSTTTTLPASTPLHFKEVEAGLDFTCGLLLSGKPMCWGGEPSDGFADDLIHVNLPDDEFESLATTDYSRTMCGLRSDGTATCWGEFYPGLFEPPESSGPYERVSMGMDHGCGLRLDATAVCWGNPQLSPPPDGLFVDVGAAQYRSCGLRPGGAIGCWDSDGWDGLAGTYTAMAMGANLVCAIGGDGALECEEPFPAPPVGTFSAIDGGQESFCARAVDETLACWSPSWDLTPPDGAFDSVSTAGPHACGVRPNHTVECWGSNEFGQLDVPTSAP